MYPDAVLQLSSGGMVYPGVFSSALMVRCTLTSSSGCKVGLDAVLQLFGGEVYPDALNQLSG